MSIVGAATRYPGLGGSNPDLRIYPQHLAGVLGLPYVGNVIYVDPNSGSDANNSGNSQDDALATVRTAEDLTVAGQNDVVLVTPTATSGRTTETDVITWDKDYTHLIGVAAPVHINTRAGMSMAAGDAGESQLDISADGCIFANLTLAAFNDTDELVEVTGSRNRFDNVHFAGLGNAMAADTAAGSCLHITGGQENLFTNCTLGLDTVTRGAANFTLELESAASRNKFVSCRFQMHADATSPFHVKLEGANAIDRWVEFENCLFDTFWTNEGDKITAVFDTSEQTATNRIYLTGHTSMNGADDWEASDSGTIWITRHTATANVVGQLINPNVS